MRERKRTPPPLAADWSDASAAAAVSQAAQAAQPQTTSTDP